MAALQQAGSMALAGSTAVAVVVSMVVVVVSMVVVVVSMVVVGTGN
jgi:hypothetical protein